jgi:hypothetical protein
VTFEGGKITTIRDYRYACHGGRLMAIRHLSFSRRSRRQHRQGGRRVWPRHGR